MSVLRLAALSVLKVLQCSVMMRLRIAALTQPKLKIPEGTSSAYVRLQSKARQWSERQTCAPG